jgi:hypothetical protein
MRTPRNQPGPTSPLGSIRGDEIQPLRLFCRNLGFGKKAWDALRHRGFPTITVGKQKLVDGAAALAFFRGLADRRQAATDSRSGGGEGE